ncbi:polar flagellum-specific ATP synthase FliI domain protein, partial [Vibrio parahaemolyticus VPTS-2010]
SGGSRSDW